ncbi:MAG: hypothetical protein KatS3mg030_356 [Saprospiraceae bacterium]|nr:MAG: hypothetical protein KatS3mg030_356 [Saprospiraceae bacterium]
MKQILAILALFALTTWTLQAQQQQTGTQAKGPVMTFETTEIDYGEIEQGSDPLRVFKFTNTGTEPLIISNAKGSCGCTVPKWPKDPILPGESATIEVRYDTNRIGPFQKTVTITTNEATPTHTLKIKGKVNPKPTQESVPASKNGFNNN